MTKSSRFLSLAVAFVGIGLASACTSSGSMQTITHDGVSAPEIAEPVATPVTPSETPNVDDDVITPTGNTDAPETPVEDPSEENSESPSETSPENPKGRRPLHEIPGIDFGKEKKEYPVVSSPVFDVLRRDVTAPEFSNVSHHGDGRKFTIVFSEPVSVASVESALTFEIFSPSRAAFVPYEGSMGTGDGNDTGKFIRFTADETIVDLDPAHVSAITFFRIRIAGADSADPSRAVKDAAGNPMAHEVLLEGTCREMPAGAPYQVECK